MLFRPSLLPGLVAFTTADCSENDPIVFNGFDSDALFCQPSLQLVVMKHWQENIINKPKTLMSFSLSLPCQDSLVILLICPFVISFTKIATQIYPKGKDDSLGNFFWMSSWLAVVFTSWVNSLGPCAQLSSLISKEISSYFVDWLFLLFLVCRFHIFSSDSRCHTEAESGRFCATA